MSLDDATENEIQAINEVLQNKTVSFDCGMMKSVSFSDQDLEEEIAFDKIDKIYQQTDEQLLS